MQSAIRTLEQEFRTFAERPDILKNTADAAMRLTEEDFQQSLLNQAEFYLHWGRLAVIAESQLRQWEEHRDRIFYECCAKVRRELGQKKEKVTDAKVETLARTMHIFLCAQQDCTSMFEVMKHLGVVRNALFQRKEMLQSYNSFQDREYREYYRGGKQDDLPSLEDLKEARKQQLRKNMTGVQDESE